jgi:hypothetical protein
VIRAFRIYVAAIAVGLSGCADPESRSTPVPIVGSTYRISPPKVTDGSELTVDILHTRKRCQQAFPNPDRFDQRHFKSHEERLESCVPKVDRASGQVQLSFRLTQRDNPNRPLLLPLEKEHVRVRHMEREVPSFELEQFEPSRVGQLFIVLIDASSSMRAVDAEGISRMQRVQNALWAARGTFITPESSVALFQFTDRVTGLQGEPIAEVQPVRTVEAFREELSRLRVSAGWTHLYSAVRTATGPLLDGETAVARFLSERDMQPTIILLTDGFNNTRAGERCEDNAGALSDTLQALQASRRKPPGQRPMLYTVGFGVGFRPGWQPPKDEVSATADQLCGPYRYNLIDGDLDKARIDNVSLRWLAEVGGGQAVIRSDHRELQQAFESTAPQRYGWYKVKYRVDPFYHRTSFTSRIVLTQFVAADAGVTLHPSAWFDVPSGEPTADGERWVVMGDIRRATGLMVPLLGGLIALGFLGPAMFNSRRALFRRSKKTSKGP